MIDRPGAEEEEVEVQENVLIPWSSASFVWFHSVESFSKYYARCSDCAAFYHFSHWTDFSKNMTQESAKCPECGTKTQTVLFKLQ